jgi:hypothetical protein
MAKVQEREAQKWTKLGNRERGEENLSQQLCM